MIAKEEVKKFRTTASGITKTTICGTDLHIMKGDVPEVENGRILGHEGVGIIEQVGGNVSNFHILRMLLAFLVTAVLLTGCQATTATQAIVDGDKLYLLGTFDHGTYKQVLDLLDSHPDVRTLVFTANGGSIDDARTLDLGREIRQRGLNTHLVSNGVLVSGGVSLFLSGVRRTAGYGTLFGVHSWEQCWDYVVSSGCRDAQDYPRTNEEHDLHGDYIETMLGDREFYWFAIGSAPSASVHWLSLNEVEEYGIFEATQAAVDPPNPFGS
ncbi:MAG TPA: alcohol dehydrogenase catalytic domain-containing protein, partial [Patescibacteria group bacterium]|nr:alcohol dehydrogenase catalytic domain-containing protein [Patescibacteria group bacterium]